MTGIYFFLIISMFLSIPMELPITISSSIMIIVLTIDILQFFFNLTLFMEKRKYSKPYKRAKNISLYRWIEGVEVEERAFFRILSEKSTNNPIENLNLIKDKIDSYCSNNITSLKLLEAYVERRLSNNFLENTKSIVIGLVVSLITSAFNKFNILEVFFQRFNNYINGTSIKFSSSNITSIVNYFTYFIIFLILFLYVSSVLTRDKRRLTLIKKIVNISINEKENSNS